MSTTLGNRLEFRVADLRKNIEDKHARAVAEADAELARWDNLDERVAEWRVEQERRLRSIVSQLRKGNVSNDTLAEFKLDSRPTRRYEYQRPTQRRLNAIAEADHQRDRALTRLDAVRAYKPEGETDAVIALTPKMANDWFGI